MFDSLLRPAGAASAPSDMDDAELVEAIQAWERLASRAAAGQLAAIAELARRRPRDLLDRPLRTAGEVAAARVPGVGPADVGALGADPADLGAGLPRAEPPGADAGEPGLPEISEFAVDEVAAALRLSRVAAGIRLHTAVELTRLPATASALRAGALDMPKARAMVDAVSPLDEPTAHAVETRVLPRAATQTVGQLRASLARAVLSVDPQGAEARHGRAVAHREVTLRARADGMAELSAILPADGAVAIYDCLDRIARRARAGDPRPMDARRADALVTAVLGRTTATPDASGGGVGIMSGFRASAVRVGAAGAGRAAGAAGAGAAGAAGGAGGASEAGGATEAALSAVVATVHVTVPAATAVGLGDEPGELAGHGPVPASMARRLAGSGIWRKVTTDPTGGAVVALDRRAYTPSAALADLVRARDRTCRFPGCRQPARRCDLDHVIPWPEGPTEATNLAALCRHHHRLKHRAGWTVEADPDSSLTWTAPTGHVYVTSPVP